MTGKSHFEPRMATMRPEFSHHSKKGSRDMAGAGR
jgi:hypothetical protein